MEIKLSDQFRPGLGRPIRAEGKLGTGYKLPMRESERQSLYRRAHQSGYLEVAEFVRERIRAAATR